MEKLTDLDLPIHGAENIGREANLIDKKGRVKLRAVYHALENGYIDADKFGKRKWVSTRRRIRRLAGAAS